MDIVIDAMSGATGDGRAAMTGNALLRGEKWNRRVRRRSHRHFPDNELGLAEVAGAGAPAPVVTFTPHLMSMSRGLLETMYVRGAARQRGPWKPCATASRASTRRAICALLPKAPRRRKPCY
jgi:N-acetyl-gamma-glutamylphosphate reductase